MGGASTGGGGGGVGPAGVRVSKKGTKTYGTAKDAKKTSTNSGGSTCFCAALIVVLDISFSILTSGKAVIAGDLP